jgi:hypothetical protein
MIYLLREETNVPHERCKYHTAEDGRGDQIVRPVHIRLQYLIDEQRHEPQQHGRHQYFEEPNHLGRDDFLFPEAKPERAAVLW